MSAPLGDERREVIPRWRDLSLTVALGELTPPLSSEPLVSPPSSHFDEKLRDWENERLLPYASEVVGAALVLGREDDAREAAQYILARPHEASRNAINSARRLIDGPSTNLKPPAPSRDIFAATIRQAKILIRTEPRNAFAWVELARGYTSLGLSAQAAKAMKAALSLGGENRHVLRSAARLFTHIGDPASANRILSRAHRTPFDPWLIAAEIGTAALSGRTPKFTREGLRLVESKNIPPLDLSELASALGTLDAKAGSHRRSRKHFRQSLIQPNENAVAQARWAATHNLIELDEDVLRLPSAFEARAWQAFHGGQWSKSLLAAKRWFRDQPFTASPAVHASYVAAIALENHEEAVRILKDALLANPHDPNLINNLSFSLASLGRLDEASAVIARYPRRAFSGQTAVQVKATAGFIAYRAGEYLIGHQLYDSALQLAKETGDRRLQAKAALFFALEALRSRSEDASFIAEKALSLSTEFRNSDFDMLRARVESSLDKNRSVGGAQVTG